MAKNKTTNAPTADELEQSEGTVAVPEVSEEEITFTPNGKFQVVETPNTVTVYGPTGLKITDTLENTLENVKLARKTAVDQQASHERNLKQDRAFTEPKK